MTLRRFIQTHRAEIDSIIGERPGRPKDAPPLTDEDRSEWIRHDESLYLWAQLEGWGGS